MTGSKRVIMPSGAKLTIMRQHFAKYYTVDYNASKAAQRAGFKPDKNGKYHKVGYLILHDPDVQTEIRAIEENTAAHYESIKTRLIREAAKIAFQNSKDIYGFDENGVSIKPSDEIDGALIKSAHSRVQKKYSKGSKSAKIVDTDMKVETWDKIKSMGMLGRWFGMDKLDITSDGQKVENNLIIIPSNGKESAVVQAKMLAAEAARAASIVTEQPNPQKKIVIKKEVEKKKAVAAKKKAATNKASKKRMAAKRASIKKANKTTMTQKPMRERVALKRMARQKKASSK